MGYAQPLFHLFLVFFKHTSIQFLQQLDVKKCPSSMLYWDLILQNMSLLP